MMMLLTHNVHKKTSPDLFAALYSTRSSLRETGGRDACGFCCDCKNNFVPVESEYRALSLRVIAFDLVPRIAKWLTNYFQGVPGVHIVNAGPKVLCCSIHTYCARKKPSPSVQTTLNLAARNPCPR
eukprot:PhF_6_TR5685/c0_g1_i2/m.8384